MPEDLKRDICSQQPLHQEVDISCVTYLTWVLKSKSALGAASRSIPGQKALTTWFHIPVPLLQLPSCRVGKFLPPWDTVDRREGIPLPLE